VAASGVATRRRARAT